MSRFKIGDRVRVKRGEGKGTLGTITHIDGERYCVEYDKAVSRLVDFRWYRAGSLIHDPFVLRGLRVTTPTSVQKPGMEERS